MKNFEYFEKDIKELMSHGCTIAVSITGEKPCDCDCINCNDCMLDVVGGTCEVLRADWLYEEYVEKPKKISKRTKAFFDAIETGWVARDAKGTIFLYNTKPERLSIRWDVYSENDKFVDLGYFSFLTLDFIKWEDEEPWSVEDIRNLEVN